MQPHTHAHKDLTSEEIMIFIMRIRIRMFLSLPDPDLLVRGTNPAPVLLLSRKNSKKKPGFLLFCDLFMNFIF